MIGFACDPLEHRVLSRKCRLHSDLQVMAVIESHSLRHTVWVAENFSRITVRIAENRRNSVGLAFKPHWRKCPVESRRLFLWGAHARSAFSDSLRRMQY